MPVDHNGANQLKRNIFNSAVFRSYRRFLPRVWNRLRPPSTCAIKPPMLETLESRTLLSGNALEVSHMVALWQEPNTNYHMGSFIAPIQQVNDSSSSARGEVSIQQVSLNPQQPVVTTPNATFSQVEIGPLMTSDALSAAVAKVRFTPDEVAFTGSGASSGIGGSWPAIAQQNMPSAMVVAMPGPFFIPDFFAMVFGGGFPAFSGLNFANYHLMPQQMLFAPAAVSPAPVINAQAPSSGQSAHETLVTLTSLTADVKEQNSAAAAETMKPITTEPISQNKNLRIAGLVTHGSAGAGSVVTLAASQIVAEFTANKTAFALEQSLPAVTDTAGLIETFLIADARAFARVADSAADRIYAEESIVWKGVAALLGTGIFIGAYAINLRSAAERDKEHAI